MCFCHCGDVPSCTQVLLLPCRPAWLDRPQQRVPKTGAWRLLLHATSSHSEALLGEINCVHIFTVC